MTAAPQDRVSPDEEPDNLDPISELEDTVTDIERVEAVTEAALAAYEHVERAATPEGRRALGRIYSLLSVAAETATSVREDGEERVRRLAEQRRAARADGAQAEAAASQPTVDELALAGRRRADKSKLRPHATLVDDARAAVERTKCRLDAWLVAVEDPLVLEAALTVHQTELEAKDAESDPSVDLLEEASNFVYRVLNGAAIASHGGAVVPECPGLDGPDHPCGAPVPRGRSLCASCEASSAYRAHAR